MPSLSSPYFSSCSSISSTQTKTDSNTNQHYGLKKIIIGQGFTYDDFLYTNNPLLVQDNDHQYSKDRINVMKQKEKILYGSLPYNRDYITHVQLDGMMEEWRKRVTRWIFEAVDYYSFNREIAIIAIDYLDRFLCRRSVDQRTFQLVTLGCLFIATKLFESRPIRMDELLALSEGRQFELNEVEAIEREILDQIGWQLYPPIPALFACFLLYYHQPVQPDAMLELVETTRYLSELVCCDYFFVMHRPSEIAIATIKYAFELEDISDAEQKAWSDRVRMDMEYIDYDFVEKCKHRLEKVYMMASSTWDIKTKGGNLNKNGQNKTKDHAQTANPPVVGKERQQTPSPTAVEKIKIKTNESQLTAEHNSLEIDKGCFSHSGARGSNDTETSTLYDSLRQRSDSLDGKERKRCRLSRS